MSFNIKNPETHKLANLLSELTGKTLTAVVTEALNFGDCFSYALAKEKGEPLLFKGNDFSKTDITPYSPIKK